MAIEDIKYSINANILSLLCILLLLLLLPLLILFSSRRRRAHQRLPPSPFGIPILGHLHLLSPIPHQSLHKLSLRYGPIMSIRLGSAPCVVASSPETAKEFLKTHELSFADRPQTKAVSYLTYGSKDFSFAPYGPYWRFMKKLCMSELLGGRTLDQLLPVRREEMMRTLRTFLTISEDGAAVDVGGELVKLTNNIICRMLMSRTCTESEGEAEEVAKMVKEMADLTGKFNAADFIGFCKNLDLQGFDKRLEDVRLRFDRMMEGILKEKEMEGRRKEKDILSEGRVKDLLDILLDIAGDDSAEMKLSMENIKAFVLDIFAAGTDTSAITMEWALAELINHPSILQKAQHEIDSTIGNNRLAEESDIPNLPYLQAILKETLRLHPTGPLIVRESTQDCKINGYDIPAQTRLFVNVWAIGRDPKHWPDPLEFRPERFVGGGDKAGSDFRGQHFQFLPFGSGRRGCPGTSLALQVTQTMLAGMIQCFEFDVGVSGSVDMREAPGLTLPREKALVCKMVPRFHPMPIG